MKKIIVFLIVVFNVFPSIKKHCLVLESLSVLQAQSFGEEDPPDCPPNAPMTYEVNHHCYVISSTGSYGDPDCPYTETGTQEVPCDGGGSGGGNGSGGDGTGGDGGGGGDQTSTYTYTEYDGCDVCTITVMQHSNGQPDEVVGRNCTTDPFCGGSGGGGGSTDCAGVPNGSAYTDPCGNCVGGTTGAIDCSSGTVDCAGMTNGSAYIDGCGNCVGGTSGNTDCNVGAPDCAGVINGSAHFDACGHCVGGTTGASACTPPPAPPDCAGVAGGTAFIDGCGVCVGGTTGLDRCNGAGGPGISPKFSHFNMTQILAEIAARKVNHSLIDQNGTGLCGVACLAKHLLDRDPDMYSKLVLGIFQNGNNTNTNTGYTVWANNNIVGHNNLLDADPGSNNYPSLGGVKMPQADFILLASIKNTMNDFTNYNASDTWADNFSGITMPSGMATMMTDFLGMKNVVNQTNLVLSAGDYTKLNDLDTYRNNGETVFMFVNSNMLQNIPHSIAPDHWITYEGGLQINTANQTVTFTAYCWGTTSQYTMSFEAFHDNYYGFVKGND